MINKDKEELENTLRHNDVMREEERVRMDAMRGKERVQMAQNTIIISSDSSSSEESLETLSDDSSYSGRKQIPTKPVTLSNIAFTFPAEHNYDNEETPLKQPHQDAFTLKQEALEIIKRLHLKCGFLDSGILFMLPKTCLEYQQYEDVNVDITQNLYNAYCTP